MSEWIVEINKERLAELQKSKRTGMTIEISHDDAIDFVYDDTDFEIEDTNEILALGIELGMRYVLNGDFIKLVREIVYQG